MESLQFLVAQYPWYSWVALPHEFTLQKQTLKELAFLLKLENESIHENTPPRINRKPTNHETGPHEFK